MAKLGKNTVTESQINHYERLEYLGDAVVEFLTRSVVTLLLIIKAL